MDDYAGQFWVHLKHIRSMAAVSGNFSHIEWLVPQPRSIFSRRVVYELLAGARCRDVEKLHRILRRRIFILIRKDEHHRQLLRLMKKLQTVTEGFTRHQDE